MNRRPENLDYLHWALMLALALSLWTTADVRHEWIRCVEGVSYGE